MQLVKTRFKEIPYWENMRFLFILSGSSEERKTTQSFKFEKLIY